MSQKRKRSLAHDTEIDASDVPSIFQSAPIDDRSSTFIGYFSSSMKGKELQNMADISSASHKMLAWRRASNQQSITGSTNYITEHDDDGEKWGGQRVAKVLDRMQVAGACVVARWYGGVMLGPARFEHIETCAKEAVQKWQQAEGEGTAKKRKIKADADDKARLVNVLAERDQSIVVLRTLAVEMEEKLRAKKEKPANESNGLTMLNAVDPKKGLPEAKAAVDYDAMTVDRLRALEKGRDATLSFLLKRIDKAETELASLDQAEAEPG